MDKSSVISIFVLIMLGLWHATIGSLIFTYQHNQPITPDTYWLSLDRYMFFAFGFLNIFIHLIFSICYFRGPYRHRRAMIEKDIHYRQQLLNFKKIIEDRNMKFEIKL